MTAGPELYLGGAGPRLRPGGWRILVDVLPRLEVGQSGEPAVRQGGREEATTGQGQLEEGVASSGQSQRAGETCSSHHGRVNYFVIVFLLLLLLPILNKQTIKDQGLTFLEFLFGFLLTPAAPNINFSM